MKLTILSVCTDVNMVNITIAIILVEYNACLFWGICDQFATFSFYTFIQKETVNSADPVRSSVRPCSLFIS